MSFWTKPLFGSARPETPASERQIRRARIREGSANETFPAMTVGYFAGGATLGLSIMGLISLEVFQQGTMKGLIDELGTLAGEGAANLLIILAMLAAFVWLFPRLLRFLFDRNTRKLTRENLAKRRVARRNMKRNCKRAGMVWALVIVIIAIFDRAFAPLMMALVSAHLGGMLIAYSLFARRGTRLVCARCEYPMLTWRGSPDQCPECGRHWKHPWGACFGIRSIRWNYIALGVLLLAFTPALIALSGLLVRLKH